MFTYTHADETTGIDAELSFQHDERRNMNNDSFYLKKTLTNLVLPPTGPVLLALLGCLLWRRYPRTGRTLAIAGTGSLLLLSLPVASRTLVDSVTVDAATERQIKAAKAIVILGGGLRKDSARRGDALGDTTLARLRRGAQLAKQYRLPVLAAGGLVYGNTSEAKLMADTLEHQYGVAVRWQESDSRDTNDNAVHSARLLRDADIDTVLLVTNAFHQRRSVREFASAGVTAVPMAVETQTEMDNTPQRLAEELPSTAALKDSTRALREILGLLVAVVLRP